MIRILINSFFAFLVGLGILYIYFHIQKKESFLNKKTQTFSQPIVEKKPEATPVVLTTKPRVDQYEFRIGTASSKIGPLTVSGVMGKKDEKQTLVFANGQTLNYFGYNVKYVGAIWNNLGGAILLLRKDDCSDCKPNRTLVIHNMSTKNIELLYPGNRNNISSKNGTIASTKIEISGYIGNCLSDDVANLIWISNLESNAKIFALDADNSIKTTHEPIAKIIQGIQTKVINRKCVEIPADDR